MEGWIMIAHLWAFFIVASSTFGDGIFGKKMWHRFLNTSVFVAFIVAVYGLFQLFGLANIHQGSVRIDASLGNAAYMAVYMMIHAFLSSYFFFTKDLKKYKLWIYGIVTLLFTFLVFETQTRGTIIGLIGGIMLASVLYSIFAKKESNKSRIISLGIVGVIVILGVVFWFNKDSQFVKDSELLSRLSTISISDVKTQARGYIWPMAINGVLERPIFGWGQENFNYIFNANYNPKMWMHEQWFDRAHNVYLDWLVAGGFVGFISYLSLYVLFIIGIWKSKLIILEKSLLTGLIAGYSIHNLFVFDNIASYVLFFAILGFANSFYEVKSINYFGSKNLRIDAVEYIMAPIIVILFILSIYFLNIRIITANTLLIDSLYGCSGKSMPDVTLFEKALSVDSYTANQEIREQLLTCTSIVISSTQIPGPTKQAFFQLSQEQIEAQKKATPKDARIYALGGMFMSGVGQTNEAVKLLEQAHKLSPAKQSIIVPLATAYINSGKDKEAVDLLKVAYESAPENTNVKSTYVIVLVISGQEKEARKIADDDKSIFESQQMGQVYATLKQYSKSIEVYRSLIKSDPSNLNYYAQLAQVQYSAGLKYDSVETLRALEKIKPELKDQIESSIKQILK
jgi:O-antigen ligase/thioredoxin-like negative regulator of GroEL